LFREDFNFQGTFIFRINNYNTQSYYIILQTHMRICGGARTRSFTCAVAEVRAHALSHAQLRRCARTLFHMRSCGGARTRSFTCATPSATPQSAHTTLTTTLIRAYHPHHHPNRACIQPARAAGTHHTRACVFQPLRLCGTHKCDRCLRSAPRQPVLMAAATPVNKLHMLRVTTI